MQFRLQWIVTGDVGVTGSVSTTVAIQTDSIIELTGAAGVTVDGVVMKDGVVTGGLTGNVTGNVTGDLTGDSAGTHVGPVTGALTGNSAGTHTGSVNVSGGTLTLANDQISGDKIDGGTISNFASTGIDDNADQTVLTLGLMSRHHLPVQLQLLVDLTVNGTLTSIASTNTTITDNTIVLNSGESGAGVTAGTAGFSIDRGTADDATVPLERNN